MSDSVKPDSEKPHAEMTGNMKEHSSSSVSTVGDQHLADIQSRLLQKARDRADSESPKPADDNHVAPVPSTRIGHSSFQSAFGDEQDESESPAAVESETFPSFPPPADAEIEQNTQSSPDENERGVLLRAQVVVTGTERPTTKKKRDASERRESRRVLLRDSQRPQHVKKETSIETDHRTEKLGSARKRSQASRYPNAEDTSLESNVSTTNEMGEEFASVSTEPSQDGEHPVPGVQRSLYRVSILGIILVTAIAASIWVVVAPSAPNASSEPVTGNNLIGEEAYDEEELLSTQITSEPSGAEVVHQGAVIGNTPMEVKQPNYEELYLLRLPGYNSQLVRISPFSSSKIHITLQPSKNTPAPES